jgi:hypothetical protein
MDKQTAKTPSSPFQSYHDYVSCLVREYPEYNWLHRFLSAPGALPSETRVQLIDSINNELRTKSFPMPHGVFNGNALREALAHRPAYITSRIVYVNYQESWSIDRAVIDVIGHYFQVNPLFFWGHLHHYYSSEDRFCPNDLRGIGNPTKPLWIAPLPSERISLELICVDTGLSALFLNANGSAGEGNTGKQLP